VLMIFLALKQLKRMLVTLKRYRLCRCYRVIEA
jgi:hypothetical protein